VLLSDCAFGSNRSKQGNDLWVLDDGVFGNIAEIFQSPFAVYRPHKYLIAFVPNGSTPLLLKQAQGTLVLVTYLN
jgi:hypothetical protein